MVACLQTTRGLLSSSIQQVYAPVPDSRRSRSYGRNVSAVALHLGSWGDYRSTVGFVPLARAYISQGVLRPTHPIPPISSMPQTSFASSDTQKLIDALHQSSPWTLPEVLTQLLQDRNRAEYAIASKEAFQSMLFAD